MVFEPFKRGKKSYDAQGPNLLWSWPHWPATVLPMPKSIMGEDFNCILSLFLWYNYSYPLFQSLLHQVRFVLQQDPDIKYLQFNMAAGAIEESQLKQYYTYCKLGSISTGTSI